MNYLGHIYFSFDQTDLAVANLFGDFVKGNKYLEYPGSIQKGVLLHRQIDTYIDNHPKVKTLTKKLYLELPKVAPISIDIYFDYLLAKNWRQFHSLEYNAILIQFYSKIKYIDSNYPDSFIQFITLLRERDWLSHYPTTFGLDKMCKGVSQKLSFPNQLINGLTVFKKNELEITTVFYEYMQDAIEHFSAIVS